MSVEAVEVGDSDRLFDPGPASVRHLWTLWGNTRRWAPPVDADVRGTPEALFSGLDAEFRFTLDVAASRGNALCARFFTEEMNGLTQPWAPERCWMNPPYSALDDWTSKALTESQAGGLVVGLLPVRADLGWFHDNVLLAVNTEVRFIRGRVAFNGMAGKAPFASMIVIWTPPASTEFEKATAGER